MHPWPRPCRPPTPPLIREAVGEGAPPLPNADAPPPRPEPSPIKRKVNATLKKIDLYSNNRVAAEFTTALLQRRHDKLFCVPRTYLKDNRTQYAYGIYQGYVLEVLLHEWLLASPHRTTDPAAADFYAGGGGGGGVDGSALEATAASAARHARFVAWYRVECSPTLHATSPR